MRWEPVVYCFSFGTLMASIITTAFSPFCRKRQVPAKRIKVNPVHDEKRVPLPEKRATPEARLGSAIRQWSSERADSDLSYVATPAPLPPPRPVAVPEPAPQPVFEDAAAEAPAADFVYQSEAAPDPEPAPREADRQAEDPPEAEESKTVSEANPFLSYDFHGAPNFYEILQISPRADLDTIHRVYRIMAARFHPDNPVSGDHEMFLKLCEAYEVLSRPERRALYDFALQAREKEPIPLFGARIFVDGLDGELHRRFGILALLYQRRRTNQVIQGISTLELESRMSLPREHLEFTRHPARRDRPQIATAEPFRRRHEPHERPFDRAQREYAYEGSHQRSRNEDQPEHDLALPRE